MDFLLATRSFRRILYLVFLVGINYAIYINPNDLNSYWAVWSAFFLSIIVWEETLVLNLKMILQAGLAFMVAVGIFSSLAAYPLLIPLGLCLLIAASMIFSQTRIQYALSALIVNSFAIISSVLPSTMIENGRRMMMVGVGVLVLLSCHLLLYLRPRKETFRVHTYTSLMNLRGLNNAIFESLVNPLYKDNLYSFERSIHSQKNKCIQSFIAFDTSLTKDLGVVLGGFLKRAYLKYENLLSKLNLLYDSLLDCSMLRFRIKDHATLKICEAELIGVFQAIDQLITDWMRLFSRSWFKPKMNTLQHIEQLLQKIFQLEENYHHFLQAVAHDPLSFFLFIASLKSLAQEMENFSRVD